MFIFVYSSLFANNVEVNPVNGFYRQFKVGLITTDSPSFWSNWSLFNKSTPTAWTNGNSFYDTNNRFYIMSSWGFVRFTEVKNCVQIASNRYACDYRDINYDYSTSGSCPAGTTLNPVTYICEAPPCNPLSDNSLSLTESQCVNGASYSDLYIKSSTLSYQTCDSTCYAMEVVKNSCDDSLLKAQSSCNVVYNDFTFNCSNTILPQENQTTFYKV